MVPWFLWVMTQSLLSVVVDGTSDDLDEPVKRCFLDVEFSKEHHLMSLNSINWARIMLQIVHYFYAYLQVMLTCLSILGTMILYNIHLNNQIL